MSNVVTVCMLKFLCCNIGKKYQNLLRTLLRRHWTALTLVLLSFQMCCIGRRMVDECHRLLFHHHNHGGTLEEHSRFHDASSGRTIRCSAQAQYRVKSKVERFEITLESIVTGRWTDRSVRLVCPTGRMKRLHVPIVGPTGLRPTVCQTSRTDRYGQTVAEPPTSVNHINVAC